MQNDEANSLLLKIKLMLMRKYEICKKLITDSNSTIQQDIDLSDEDDDEFEDKELSNYDDESLETNEEDIEENNIDITNEDMESSIISCNRVLRFLQLLCENHNLELQNFLREQKTEDLVNNKSFDFVSHISLMFGNFIKEYTN